jgi:hypothetical protein
MEDEGKSAVTKKSRAMHSSFLYNLVKQYLHDCEKILETIYATWKPSPLPMSFLSRLAAKPSPLPMSFLSRLTA